MDKRQFTPEQIARVRLDSKVMAEMLISAAAVVKSSSEEVDLAFSGLLADQAVENLRELRESLEAAAELVRLAAERIETVCGTRRTCH